MAADASYDERLRAAAFAHLDRLRTQSPNGALRSADINSFPFEDRTQRLIVQTGIWKPAGLDAALSIRTTYTPPTEARPYEDEVGEDGFLRYKYRGTDPNHSDNPGAARGDAHTSAAHLLRRDRQRSLQRA